MWDGNSNTLKVILRSLKDSGYDVYYHVLNASDYGVAQIRKRIYLVCFHKDLDISFQFPKRFESNVAIEDYLEPCTDESCFIDPKLITLYKEDLANRISNTCRIGYIGERHEDGHIGQGQRIFPLKATAQLSLHLEEVPPVIPKPITWTDG